MNALISVRGVVLEHWCGLDLGQLPVQVKNVIASGGIDTDVQIGHRATLRPLAVASAQKAARQPPSREEEVTPRWGLDQTVKG